MYLKSLTLKGFKSFASATTLNFEPGITAIVGPNGSGKSNIVDALSWVMGEQGAKTLRGAKMEDVIFAGTSKRAPLGRAEVALTIDNSDGTLPIDYSEVTISRTLFRSGGSEYAINGTNVRLLDVQELLSDTGMGREMHVIVGQGQLDAVLTSTPEQRRVFIEEAAGVLKHRKRREKAARKLDSTSANLSRLNDVITEIRRQLKPLGRQAEVARKAAIIQSELRDARARLLAEELTEATDALESGMATEAEQTALRIRLEGELQRAQQIESDAESRLSATQPVSAQAQENWYALAGLSERVSTVISISAERMRHREGPHLGNRRDPEQLEADAKRAEAEEKALQTECADAEAALKAARLSRESAEQEQLAAEKAYSTSLRAVADRREGLAKLTGQVNSQKSRLDAMQDEQSRLLARLEDSQTRAQQAERSHTELETQIAGLRAGEIGLDAEYEAAEAKLDALQSKGERLRIDESEASQLVASLSARTEALALSLERRDGGTALLENNHSDVLGRLSSLISVEDGWQVAVSVALGSATEAIAVSGISGAVRLLQELKNDDLGRSQLILADAPVPTLKPLPNGFSYLVNRITVDPRIEPALSRLLANVVGVGDLAEAEELVNQAPDVIVVTQDGELLSGWSAIGGSADRPSLIEVQAAYDESSASLESARHEQERLRFALAGHENTVEQAKAIRDAALEKLNESDAQLTSIADRLSSLAQVARSARAEAERMETALSSARLSRESQVAALSELQSRLEAAQDDHFTEPDSSQRDELTISTRLARQTELDASLALRTVQERARSAAGRAQSLHRAAAAERLAVAEAIRQAEQLKREAAISTAVNQAASWLSEQVKAAQELASQERTAAEGERVAAEQRLGTERNRARELARQLDEVVQGSHHDELTRIEQRMRIEQLSERGLTLLGLSADVLIDEYGPHQLVPVLTLDDGEEPRSVPYNREEQAKRLRKAEQELSVLGRVNPLALEEFEAMSARHNFLAEQVEDLKRTRKDLLDIIEDIDDRMQEVFVAAYEDVERTFAEIFTRLFPGGEGKLLLTSDDPLTAGIDVEARPAGKKVKRLSLLSGGERSLVAVAFLLSLFIARPSPFYILDEVEAALDDMNLGRLLDIYKDLGVNSQLLMITHQKRTMEIAESLYGVTMRGDGVSTVISQRLQTEE